MPFEDNTTIIVLEGRRIDITGNTAQIMDVDDTKVDQTMQARDAAGLFRMISDWLSTNTVKNV